MTCDLCSRTKTEQRLRMSQQSELQKGLILRLTKLELDVMQHHYTERSGQSCQNLLQKKNIWAYSLYRTCTDKSTNFFSPPQRGIAKKNKK